MSRQLPPLKSLPAFIETAKTLSVSKAADSLFITHSAVSQSIKSLENYLGKKLFERDKGRLNLTNEGTNYYLSIKNALEMIETATRQLTHTKEDHILHLNLGHAITMLWFIPMLPELQTKHPELEIHISNLGRAINFDQDNIDLSIQCTPPDDPRGMHTEHFGEDYLVLAANPNLLKKKRSLKQLLQEEKAIYASHDYIKHEWKKWCHAMGVNEPLQKNRIHFPSSAYMIEAALAGGGLVVTREVLLAESLRTGLLEKVSQKRVKCDLQLYLVCKENALKNNPYLLTLKNWLMTKRVKQTLT